MPDPEDGRQGSFASPTCRKLSRVGCHCTLPCIYTPDGHVSHEKYGSHAHVMQHIDIIYSCALIVTWNPAISSLPDGTPRPTMNAANKTPYVGYSIAAIADQTGRNHQIWCVSTYERTKRCEFGDLFPYLVPLLFFLRDDHTRWSSFRSQCLRE